MNGETAIRPRLARLDYSILQQCMHCGLCLPTCPTYVATKNERSSPRGRIALMRSIADGEMNVSRAFGEEMYYCLGCLACETACPAGVSYGELFEAARADVEQVNALENPRRTFWRWLALDVLFMRPRLLRAAGALLRGYQRSGLERLFRALRLTWLLPGTLRKLEPQTPRMSDRFSHELIDGVERPCGEVKHRVALLTGCVQDLAFSDVNRDTADVLLANGCEVVTPSAQHCCGSLHAHNGAPHLAAELARKQIDMIDPESVDAIITNAGGCGSHLKHYSKLLGGDSVYAERARLWDSKVKDIHEWLVVTGFRQSAAGCGISEVTYHESCHLCHGQKITSQPRTVLSAIPGLRVIELKESNWCCGSAGIYNITQPEESARLLARKLDNIGRTQAPAVATSNPGCHLQLAFGLRNRIESMCRTVTQPVSLLAAAYRGESKSVERQDPNYCAPHN